MADLGGTFNAKDTPTADEFDVVPEGMYSVAIVKSDWKDTSKGGRMLNLQMSILDGPHANRKVFTGLNLDNSNPVAVKMAKAELSSICHATGVLEPSDSGELHSIPFMVKVGLEKRADTGGTQNVVKAYFDANGKQPWKAANGKTATTGTAPASATDAPWNQ